MLLYFEEYSYVIKKSTSDTKKKTQLAFASKVAKSQDASSARKAVEKHVPCSSGASTSSITFVDDSGKQNESGLIAYVYKLSPVKRNRKNTMDYSTLMLQPETDTIEAICIPKTNTPLLVNSANSHTPLKIQRFTKSSDGKKLIINEMTRVGIANQGEYTFQYKELSFKTSSIRQILESSNEWDSVSLRAKAIHVGDITEAGAKKLKLRQSSMENGRVYLLGDLHVRIWAGVKKVSTTVDTTVKAIVDETLEQIPVTEEIQTDDIKTINVPNIAFVQKVEKSIACKSCSRRVLQSTDAKIVHCDRCGATLRISDCRPQLCAKVVVEVPEGEQISLTIFQNVLQSVIKGDFDNEGVAEALLGFEELKIKFNTNTFVVSELSF